MSTSRDAIERIAEWARSGQPFVVVTTVETHGSTPQDAGSKMLVSAPGLEWGTVGGGRLEHQAVEHAQRLLADTTPAATTELVEWNLQRDVGMTCGGVVRLFFEVYNHGDWNIVIFGAGHVAHALVRVLLTLDCHVTCIDPRQEWLSRLPDSPQLSTICDPEPAQRVPDVPDRASLVIMTMGHRTDRPILRELLQSGREFSFLGVIGSLAKRNVLERELIADGIDPDLARQFTCPVGLDLGTNQPGEIAVSIAAQLIQQRDVVRAAAP